MNSNQIHSNYKLALNYLAMAKIKNAFEIIKELVDELQIGKYADNYEELQQNYKYLLQYYIKGVDDPQRKSVYNKLIAKIFILTSELREELLLVNSSNTEYTSKRYFPYSKLYRSSKELEISLMYYHSQSIILKNLDSTHKVELERIRSNYETALNELFKTFWLNTSYNAEDKALYTTIFSKEYKGWLEPNLLISALALNLWRMFDESKLILLLDCCLLENQENKQRALVGLCFVLAKYNRFIQFFPNIRNRLVLLTDNSHTIENFKNIIIQIISTVDTDKISKKLKEEILPEVMKISPLLKDKMDAENLLKSDEWDEGNPEWQEMIEKSGVSDKLQELNELQLEGADVYMSTFSMLKSFPFFNEISNWFLPFDTKHSTINELFEKEEKSVLSAFVGNNSMCNSDKYSFCLSIIQMPESQRNMLKQSFKLESEQLDEMAKDEALLSPDITSKNISKQYIQDLFRFFKLYSQKENFSNMFASSLFMHQTYLFDILAANSDVKNNIAEYYFAKNHYQQAIVIFNELIDDHKPEASIYQKLGYSYQQTSQISKALESYLKADLIHPDDPWTIKKIALCYRLTGNFTKALEHYLHADFLNPNQTNIQLQIAKCYAELSKFKEALNIYFKLDAETDGNIKVWKAISWCTFVSGNLSQAEYYIKKILEMEKSVQNYINAGHIFWCNKNNEVAIDNYLNALKYLEFNSNELIELIQKDKQYIIANGVDKDEFMLFIDEILYRISN